MRKNNYILLGLFVMQTITGCTKNDEGPVPGEGPKENLKTLTISVRSITAPTEESDNLRASQSPSKRVNNPTIRKGKIEEKNGFDVLPAITTAVNNDNAFEASPKALKAGVSSLKKAAKNTIGNDVKYRVLLYIAGEGNTETYHSSHLFTGAEDQEIDVEINNTYHWYAYSYNTSEAPADISDQEAPTLAIENVDFIYANGSIELTEENNSISVAFKRKTSKVAVEIDARGMFADKISQLQVDMLPNVLYGATFDLKTGQPVSTTAYTPTGLTLADFTIGDETLPDFGGIVRKEFYTAKEDSISGEIFTLKSFTIQDIADEDDKTMSFTNANSTFSTPTIQNTYGNAYHFRQNLVQSALYIYTVGYARGNLYDRDNSLAPGENRNGTRYKFRNHGYDGSIPNDLNKDVFRVYSSVAGVDNTDSLDACAQIYPEGTWTSIPPRSSAFYYLSVVSYERGFASRFNSLVLYHLVTGTGAPYPDNMLQFTMGGHYLIEQNGTKTFKNVTYYSARDHTFARVNLEEGAMLVGSSNMDRLLMNLRCIRATP